MSNAPGQQLQAYKSASSRSLGIFLLFCVAVIWVVSSFIAAKLEKSDGQAGDPISPFYLTYIGTSLFIIYLPMVYIKNCVCGQSETFTRWDPTFLIGPTTQSTVASHSALTWTDRHSVQSEPLSATADQVDASEAMEASRPQTEQEGTPALLSPQAAALSAAIWVGSLPGRVWPFATTLS